MPYLVSLTQVLGVPRGHIESGLLSANMLSTAKVLCQELFGPQQGENSETFNPTQGQGVPALVDSMPAFINTNGDAQTWFNLCTMNHASPVHQDASDVIVKGVPSGICLRSSAIIDR